MIRFSFSLFSHNEEFPIHFQYGFHEKDDCYVHGHEDFSELVIVLEGSAQHIVNNETYPISKGDIFVINPFTAHGFTSAQNLQICNIMFKPESVFSEVYDMKQMPGFQALFVLEPHYFQNHSFCSQLRLKAGEFADVTALIHSTLAEYNKKDDGWRDLVFSRFLLLCITLSRLYRTNTENDTVGFLKLAGAIAHIENHYCTALTTESLAKIAGYSERQFLRLFKSVFSITPTLYITNLRIKKAQTLLKTSTMSIGEIAWNCGYDDHNYFSRQFKKQTGMTPTEYQSLVRG